MFLKRRLSYIFVMVVAGSWSFAPTSCAAASADLAHYVNPFNGTQPGQKDFGTGGGAGNTFPGPVMPFGMMQMSPDTMSGSKNPGGSYAYDDTRIRGFSVRRLGGAGCPTGGDFSFLPTTLPIEAAPTTQFSTSFANSFLPTYSHADESASPGYYQVGLDPGTAHRIDTRLTATTRSGVARFTFPANGLRNLLINATGSRTGASVGSIRIDPARQEVTGSVTTGAFCMEPERYKIYFAAHFDKAFKSFGTWVGQQLHPGSTAGDDVSAGNPLGLLENGPLGYVPTGLNTFVALGLNGTIPSAQTGGYLSFDQSPTRNVEMRMGMSFVSVDGARHNLAAEAGSRPFDTIRRTTRSAWDRMLGRIVVHGGRSADRKTFYSMLYHAFVSPTTFNDADGRYIGFDDKIHDAGSRTQYADFSGWDVYRSQMPLLALVAPHQASDIAASLLADAQQGGWLPKWSVANTNTEVMTGDPADPTLAAIWALGAHGFDARGALAAMVKGATKSSSTDGGGYVERAAVAEYQELGYVPDELSSNYILVGLDAWRRALLAPLPGVTDLAWGSAGTTLEYATADFAVARMAAAVGDNATCETFLARSGNWRNVFDTSIGYPRPRSITGQWVSDFDPNYNDSSSGKGYPEGDGAQYTWMIPQDPAGLFAALGGRDKAAARLDTFFEKLNTGFASPYAFMGNEPNSNAPWLYDWLGQPSKAADIVRRTILSLFDSSPGGYPGNDDLGQMSAWYIFGALGIYPAIPGSDVLALGSPLFPKATVRLAGGKLVINGGGAARTASYVKAVSVDGRPWAKPWLYASDLAHGGKLDFSLTAKPGSTWGTAESGTPPSFGPGNDTACAA